MSTWLSADDLRERIKTFEEKEKLFELYGLSVFCAHAFLSQGFEPSPKWADCVALTQHAIECIDKIHQRGIQHPGAHEIFSLFQIFYHYDLFVDYMKTEVEPVRTLVNEMHKAGQAKWPYVFGNGLYHKFNDSHQGGQTDHLDAPQVEDLLRGTPQGVFQMGKIVSGPFGFLRGLEERMLEPTLKVTLWHCSDPGCLARHNVQLIGFKSPFQRSKDSILHSILDLFGPPSEWDTRIMGISRMGKWPNGRPYYDLPAIIGDCIIGKERTNLLIRCLRSPSNSILMNALSGSRRKAENPKALAEGLTAAEQHQLLLLITDRDLVGYIDELIAKKEILIPPAEMRSKKTYAIDYYRDTASGLSSLGIRSRAHPAVLELASAVWSTYETLGILDDLLWRLRGREGTTLRHSVLDFIRVYGPEKTVQDLILSSRAITKAITEKMNFQIFQGENESVTIRRLLWKLGFNLARYEDSYQILRDRIHEFEKSILQLGSELAESDKAQVRGIGVNLFVSVESFLEDLICYNVWLLSSDHFTGTNFHFTKSEAQKAITKTLGQKLVSESETLRWSTEGSNTLGTLLMYLEAYRAWLKGRPGAEKTEIVRKKQDYPHYADDTVFVFPFKHTALWADVPPQIMAAYTDIIDKLCIQIAQANLAAVRNGLEHKREEDKFPEPDKMLACASRLHQVVKMADDFRLVPKLYWGIRSECDNHYNVCETFSDYRGSTVTLWDPPTVLGIPQNTIGVPCLIAPFDFLGQPNSILIFSVTSRSEYSEYWENYPRRRFIPSTQQDRSRDSLPDLEAEQSVSSACSENPERVNSNG